MQKRRESKMFERWPTLLDQVIHAAGTNLIRCIQRITGGQACLATGTAEVRCCSWNVSARVSKHSSRDGKPRMDLMIRLIIVSYNFTFELLMNASHAAVIIDSSGRALCILGNA